MHLLVARLSSLFHALFSKLGKVCAALPTQTLNIRPLAFVVPLAPIEKKHAPRIWPGFPQGLVGATLWVNTRPSTDICFLALFVPFTNREKLTPSRFWRKFPPGLAPPWWACRISRATRLTSVGARGGGRSRRSGSSKARARPSCTAPAGRRETKKNKHAPLMEDGYVGKARLREDGQGVPC